MSLNEFLNPQNYNDSDRQYCLNCILVTFLSQLSKYSNSVIIEGIRFGWCLNVQLDFLWREDQLVSNPQIMFFSVLVLNKSREKNI